MTLESILAILTTVFGSSSVITGYMLWQTRKANKKSADALAHTEEANSLKATGEVYTLLTEITRKELLEFTKQIQSLKNIANSQDIEITTLKRKLHDYELRCGSCLNQTK